MRKDRIDIITLGCSKNLVDSEALGRMFNRAGYDVAFDADDIEGETVVINTCGFIEDAKQESIDTILELTQAKEAGMVKRLYVMGCLSQRYKKELEQEIPQVDKYYGKFDYKGLLKELGTISSVPRESQTKGRHYCYVKISEGCDRHCAYCAIPIITGKHKSRPIDEILDEVRLQVKEGVSEFQIIAQELTYYGLDLYGERKIAELVKKIANIEGVKWVRLHYAYPKDFPMELLDVLRDTPQCCKYLDIALQHISTSVLHRMRRNITKEETIEFIKTVREKVPGITLRTTMMVGYPGETDEEFSELLEFVKWARFERLGAFTYSEEEGTYSAKHYADDVAQEVKQQRLDKLMRVQQNISAELQAEQIGTEQTIIIDRLEGEWYIGRQMSSSPEVDPEVLVSANEQELEIGKYYNVKITGAEEFDLYASVIEK